MDVRDRLFIGGEWVDPATATTIDVISPNTEEIIGRVPEAGEKDIDLAVEVARRAFDDGRGEWPSMSPAERGAAIGRLSEAIMARGEEIANVISAQNGSPAKWSFMGQVLAATMVLNTYAGIAGEYPFVEDRMGAMGQPVQVRRAPVGVAAGIVPWNVPLFIMALKLGPAMSAGVPIIIKPAPETPLDPYLLADAILEAEIPAGAISILAADRAGSEYLVRHPGVDKVSFTGSTATGKLVGEICGGSMKRFALELGGKSAAIVLDDWEIEPNLGQLVDSGLMNNGQACGAQTRILVSRNRYAEVVDALAAHLGALKTGDSLDPETDIGPLVARRQRDRVVELLESGRSEGARAVVGGGTPADLDKGWFIEPTVFADADNTMRIAREEIFGPVLTVIPYEDEADAVAIANDSPYGLCGSVWTADRDHAIAIGSQMRTGCVAVNSSLILDFNSPFGGFKDSGMGRELGPEGIDEYIEYQSIILPAG